jgi:hypothetical protein
MRRRAPVASLIASLTLMAAGAVAQDSAPPTSPPQQQPSSLDELLDLEKEKPQQPADEGAATKTDDVAAQESRRELEKQLSEAEVADAFEQAVEKMGVAAELLDVRFDPSLPTQRVQEDIIAKLNQLLDQAKKNKSQSSSSSSSSQQQQQQQQQDPGKRPQQQNQKPGSQRNQDPADNRSEMEPPESQQGDINTVLEETRSEWGNLPQRIRDMLVQGRKEKFSTLYERLTNEYYKRLAEENSP